MRIQFLSAILLVSATINACASSQGNQPQSATAETISAIQDKSDINATTETKDNASRGEEVKPDSGVVENNPDDVTAESQQLPQTAVEGQTETSSLAGVENPQSIDESNASSSEAVAHTGSDGEQIGSSELSDVNTTSTTENTESIDVNLSPAQQLAAKGDFFGAWKLALENYRNGNDTTQDEFWSLIEKDPLMTETLDETVRPHGTNELAALGGGSTVSLKYLDSADESAKAAIKPDQDLRQTMYRSEIAYYRLCQILGCSYDTPVTRPVRWTKADFNALYRGSTSPKNRGYSAKFEHLIWATEDKEKILYGAYKEWISPMTLFPIEVTSAWAMYLRPNTTRYPDLNTFLRNLLSGSRDGDLRGLKKLMEYAGDLSTRDILRQISDITLVDFITNNWDRYAGAKDNYGANCHFQPGGIIAIDNGAAFPPWHSPRVVNRLHNVQVFSRDLVQTLRILDPDKLFDHLFPNPTHEEEKGRARFKERRTQALEYIDGLIKKHGEDKILVF